MGEDGDQIRIEEDGEGFEPLLEYIKRSRGFDFTGYKRTGLRRRILRRMQTLGIAGFTDYTDHLETHTDEFTHLFNTILINVTGFFRDPATWEYVAHEVVPELLKQKREHEPFRIWSAACATGEEAYTAAIVLLEALGPEAFEHRVKVFATDVDEDALQQARAASYTDHQVEGIPQPLLTKYFEQQGTRYVFRNQFRRAIIFGRNDLMQDAPISKIDLLLCRNALMYFNAEAQARALQRLHFALNENGVLLMGKAEMLFSRTNLFVPLDLKRRAFVKVPRTGPRDRLVVQTGGAGGNEANIIPASHDGRAGHAMLENARLREAAYALDPLATMVFDHDGYLVLASAQARHLFRLTDRDIGRPLQDLELSYRPLELRSRVDEAVATRRTVEVKEVSWQGPAGETRFFEVQVLPLVDANDALLGVRCAFHDVTRFRKLQEELQQSHQELETAYEELQSTNEERETASEELQSTNEELETTNEEIQSTNEELETMNEELQSTNEELQATNEQLRARTDELGETNGFLRSILASITFAVVVVDKEMRVRAWNEQAHEMWGLRDQEVVGEHFLALDIGLPVDRLRQTIKGTLNGEADGALVIPAINRRGRQLSCRVQCVPVHSDGAGITGVILTMAEDGETPP
jgi:two-component system, chemotaxis family, CheB/CheR fusion protein